MTNATKKPTPKTLIIECRQWSDKTYGNTYNTIEITADGKIVYTSDFADTGSSSEYYMQMAAEALVKLGYFDDKRSPSTNVASIGIDRYCRENGIQCHHYVIPGLKRDLHCKL